VVDVLALVLRLVVLVVARDVVVVLRDVVVVLRDVVLVLVVPPLPSLTVMFELPLDW
jgi:hypothetical protein